MTFKVWIHGLIAALLGALGTAGAAALAVPKDFNLSHDGLIDFAKIIGIPGSILRIYVPQAISAPIRIIHCDRNRHQDHQFNPGMNMATIKQSLRSIYYMGGAPAVITAVVKAPWVWLIMKLRGDRNG